MWTPPPPQSIWGQVIGLLGFGNRLEPGNQTNLSESLMFVLLTGKAEGVKLTVRSGRNQQFSVEGHRRRTCPSFGVASFPTFQGKSLVNEWDFSGGERDRFYVLSVYLGPETLIMKVLFILMLKEQTTKMMLQSTSEKVKQNSLCS